MKKILVLCAAMTLVASMAFAQGADLTVVGCPGNAGSSGDAGTLDCAGGATLVLLGTFVTAAPISDLAGIDIIFDFQVTGDLGSDANFWDFANVNAGAIGAAFSRPATLCTGYTNTWPSGSIAGAQGVSTAQPNHGRVVALCARSAGFAVAGGAKLFGIQLTVDASTSAEGGGSGVGCALPVGMVLNSIQPRTVSGIDPGPLSGGALAGQCVTVNGGTGTMCGAVPAKKHTWGQLKSLYR